MCLECLPEAHLRTPEIAPDSQFIVWQPCRAYFFTKYAWEHHQTMNFRLCRFQGTPEYASRACLVHVFDFFEFHRKSSDWKKVLGASTRPTFPTCTCERSLQHVAVANDFVQNSYSRCMILTRLHTKPMRNTHKFMPRSWKYNMPCDIIAISHALCWKAQHIYTCACIC